jgi:DNA-cytosine methyltransferase
MPKSTGHASSIEAVSSPKRQKKLVKQGTATPPRQPRQIKESGGSHKKGNKGNKGGSPKKVGKTPHPKAMKKAPLSQSEKQEKLKLQHWCRQHQGVTILAPKQTKEAAQSPAPPPIIFVGEDCAGLGGATLTVQKILEASDQKIVTAFVCEKDPQVLRMNKALARAQGMQTVGYIKRVQDRAKDTYVDLYTAGPPCQPWSPLSLGQGLGDERGRVLFHCIRFITTDPRPKAFVLEEVANFYWGHTAEFQDAIKQLLRADYQVSWDILNANEQGSAQSRRRIFVVGIRKDCVVNDFTFPKLLKRVPPVDAFLDWSPADDPPRFAATQARNHKRHTGRMEAEMKAGTIERDTTCVLDLNGGHRFGQIGWEACPCITRSRGKQKAYYISNQNRYLNIKETGRLQGYTSSEVDTILGVVPTHSTVGAAFGNAMNKSVLQRLLPRVLFAAGLIKTKLDDPWKKANWESTPAGKLWPDYVCQQSYF